MRLINADELRDIYSGVPNGVYTTGHFITAIDECETIDAAPVKHGRWIENEGFDGDCYYTCSVCHCDWVTIDGTPTENNVRYCPECGAKMDLEE